MEVTIGLGVRSMLRTYKLTSITGAKLALFLEEGLLL